MFHVKHRRRDHFHLSPWANLLVVAFVDIRVAVGVLVLEEANCGHDISVRGDASVVPRGRRMRLGDDRAPWETHVSRGT